mmetsp:Transcript_44726/g.71564  ORF Transcript_44726/g.71564 Transcript_44726/m.71564 type:complete len:122 (-) Transcript_44726:87-452(-)
MSTAKHYQLQEYLPENVQGSQIPRFQCKFKELLKFENWQGIGWVRPLYFLVALLLIVSTVVMEVNFVLTKQWITITFGSLFCFVFLFVGLILNRIIMEVVISVLTIPHLIPLLQKQQEDRV